MLLYKKLLLMTFGTTLVCKWSKINWMLVNKEKLQHNNIQILTIFNENAVINITVLLF